MGNTAFEYAERAGDAEMVELLLEDSEVERQIMRRAPCAVTGNTKSPFAPPAYNYSWESFWTPLQCAMSSLNANVLFTVLHRHITSMSRTPVDNGESLFCIALYYGNIDLLPSLVLMQLLHE